MSAADDGGLLYKKSEIKSHFFDLSLVKLKNNYFLTIRFFVKMIPIPSESPSTPSKTLAKFLNIISFNKFLQN